MSSSLHYVMNLGVGKELRPNSADDPNTADIRRSGRWTLRGAKALVFTGAAALAGEFMVDDELAQWAALGGGATAVALAVRSYFKAAGTAAEAHDSENAVARARCQLPPIEWTKATMPPSE